METEKEKLIKTLEDEMRRSSIPFPKGNRENKTKQSEEEPILEEMITGRFPDVL